MRLKAERGPSPARSAQVLTAVKVCPGNVLRSGRPEDEFVLGRYPTVLFAPPSLPGLDLTGSGIKVRRPAIPADGPFHR